LTLFELLLFYFSYSSFLCGRPLLIKSGDYTIKRFDLASVSSEDRTMVVDYELAILLARYLEMALSSTNRATTEQVRALDASVQNWWIDTVPEELRRSNASSSTFASYIERRQACVAHSLRSAMSHIRLQICRPLLPAESAQIAQEMVSSHALFVQTWLPALGDDEFALKKQVCEW
jgi:hypothetical protein